MEHVQMTAIAVGFAIVIGVPLGILISYVKKLDKPIIGVANVVQAIPSMALLGLAIPLLGIGVLPAVVMVIIYSLLPIIKNTYTGIASIDPEMVEAAKGIGLTKWQVLTKVKIPHGAACHHGRCQNFRCYSSGTYDHGGLYRSWRSGDTWFFLVSEQSTTCRFWPVQFQRVCLRYWWISSWDWLKSW